MFKKILIANRGEIALRIIWACKEMGIKTVAIYSEEDRDSLHVRFADEEVCVGPAHSSESYLNVPNIISAAEITDADAIHPGYGFLAENPHLAEICETCQIKFIGPDPRTIRLMGDKSEARKQAKKVGLSIIPGSQGIIKNDVELKKLAEKIGYPLMLKAAGGGGGKGMRIVEDREHLLKEFRAAETEAAASFGSANLYLERYIKNPRHIEIQILGDNHKNIIHLGERECSIQRKYQKILEESPSPAISVKLLKKMGNAAVDLAKEIGYNSAGTIEFLLDDENNYYFMEMNTRIQVEHPVTECRTNIDLVKQQIRIAAGKRLAISQKDVQFKGHSIECRINAEDPETFAPSPGTITAFHPPLGPGIRVDTAVYEQCRVSPFYDSMVAKLISFGNNREEAIHRMRRALECTIIEGIKTNIPLHLKILADPDFIKGKYSTQFLSRFSSEKKKKDTGKSA